MAREHKLKKASLGTGFMIGIAVIYLLFGLAMLFVPQFQERYIIYIAGLLFLICGVIMIVKYFMAASYNDLGNYGFSGGVLCILLGICLLVRTQQIAGYLPLFLGVCILLTAVIKLQNAVDLKSIRNGAWFLFLIIALAFLTAAILVILNPDGKVLQHREVLYYILIADGVVSIISPIYLVFAIRAGKRAKHSNRKENGKEAGSVEIEKHTTEESGDQNNADASELIKETKKHANTTSKGKSWKKSAKKHASEKEDDWYYDEEDPIPSVAEKNTDAKEKDTIDHISEEILGFFKDEDK